MRRIDAHMARGNELMDRLSREERADTRAFVREITVRIEREGRARAAESRDLLEQGRDLREESRAQRLALLVVLDRLEPGGASA